MAAGPEVQRNVRRIGHLKALSNHLAAVSNRDFHAGGQRLKVDG
jgi:hypothetical protein